MKRALLTLLSVLLLSLSLAAQGQQGTLTTSPPPSMQNPNTVKVQPPPNAPSGTTIEITKVEQQLVGGGWSDVTNVVTICGKTEVRFGEDVSNHSFRISYKLSTTTPPGDQPRAEWSSQQTACPILGGGRGAGA